MNFCLDFAAQGVDSFLIYLDSIGESGLRQRLFRYGLAQGLDILSVCHLNAILSPRAHYSRSGQFLPGSIINAGAEIGVPVCPKLLLDQGTWYVNTTYAYVMKNEV